MTRTNDPRKAAAYIYRLIQDDITHGLYTGAGEIEDWAHLHDFVDANEYLEIALTLDAVSDHDLCDTVSHIVDDLLTANPLSA